MSSDTRDRLSLFLIGSPGTGKRFRDRLEKALAAVPIFLSDDRPGETGAAILVLDSIGETDLPAIATCSQHSRRRLIVAVECEATQIEWQALAAGASDVVTWSQLLAHADGLWTRLQRWQLIDDLIASPLVHENLVGQSPAWTSLLRRVVEVAAFTTAPIVLLGQSGTGKELLARLIHTLDRRPGKRDLIVVDCTTVMPELSGSEFFGHDKGAYTNAHAPREGAFALADKGTLFLDEVGELPLALQAQLLRVVQERTFKRLGSNHWQRTDFRLICATNRDLEQETEGGGFRRDLYYRLAGWVFHVPSLADRRDDILPLARHFLGSVDPRLTGIEFAPSVANWLRSRAYPGNIRDLRQLVSRIAARHLGDGPITLADVPEDERPAAGTADTWPDERFAESVARAVSLGLGLREISRAASDIAIRSAIVSSATLREAARSLGVTDRALQLRQANGRLPRVLN